MVEENISEIIKALRAALDMTQEQFANNIGVTVSTVNRWENNKGVPSPLAMLRIKKMQKNQKTKGEIK
jgi:putative transcriptional regulator